MASLSHLQTPVQVHLSLFNAHKANLRFILQLCWTDPRYSFWEIEYIGVNSSWKKHTHTFLHDSILAQRLTTFEKFRQSNFIQKARITLKRGFQVAPKRDANWHRLPWTMFSRIHLLHKPAIMMFELKSSNNSSTWPYWKENNTYSQLRTHTYMIKYSL